MSEFICHACGKKIQRKHKPKGRCFCGPKCLHQWMSTNFSKKASSKKTNTKQRKQTTKMPVYECRCAACRKNFLKYNKPKSKNQFCSKECHNAWMRKTALKHKPKPKSKPKTPRPKTKPKQKSKTSIELRCSTCKRKFIKERKPKGKEHFCCKKCHNEWMSNAAKNKKQPPAPIEEKEQENGAPEAPDRVMFYVKVSESEDGGLDLFGPFVGGEASSDTEIQEMVSSISSGTKNSIIIPKVYSKNMGTTVDLLDRAKIHFDKLYDDLIDSHEIMRRKR